MKLKDRLPNLTIETRLIDDDVKTSNEGREWSEVFVNNTIIKNNDFLITCKNRSDAPVPYIADKLYSSLKYEIHVDCSVSNVFKEIPPFLVVKMSVIDTSGQEITKKGKPVLKGSIESVLNNVGQKDNDKFFGKLKIQFDGLTSHFDKKEYQFLLSIYSPKDLVSPISQWKSASFLIYARKPNKRPESFDIPNLSEKYHKLSKDNQEKANTLIESKLKSWEHDDDSQ